MKQHLNSKAAMLFATCDNYSDAWLPYFKCMKMNWPEFSWPIYFCSESKGFELEGLDIRCPLKNDKDDNKQWSKRLLKTLRSVKEEYVLLTLDDFWLTSRVNDKKVQLILSILENDSSKATYVW